MKTTWHTRFTPAGRRDQGSAIIEIAVVLPVFSLLLVGMLVFGMALISYLSATYATGVAARYASLHSTTSDAPCTTQQVTSLLQSQLYMPNVSSPTPLVSYTNANGNAAGNTVGNVVEVSMTWTQNINVPYYGPKTFNVSAKAYRSITR